LRCRSESAYKEVGLVTVSRGVDTETPNALHMRKLGKERPPPQPIRGSGWSVVSSPSESSTEVWAEDEF